MTYRVEGALWRERASPRHARFEGNCVFKTGMGPSPRAPALARLAGSLIQRRFHWGSFIPHCYIRLTTIRQFYIASPAIRRQAPSNLTSPFSISKPTFSHTTSPNALHRRPLPPFEYYFTRSASVVASNSSQLVMADIEGSEKYRLPVDVRPKHYDLSIKTDLEKLQFEGTVTIEYVL